MCLFYFFIGLRKGDLRMDGGDTAIIELQPTNLSEPMANFDDDDEFIDESPEEEDDDEDDEKVGDWFFSNAHPATQKLRDLLKNRFLITLPCLREESLPQAMSDSIFHQPARPLIICIHNERSISRNVFWHHVMKNESIVAYLNEHFLVWGWNYTSANANE